MLDVTLAFTHDTLAVVMNPTRENNWVGYPSVDGIAQKKFFIELTKCKDGSNIAAIVKKGKGSSERSFDRATDHEVMDGALKALGQMLKGEEVTVPPVSRMNPPRPIPETFLIECEHCAVVPGPGHTKHHVIFNPKGDTLERARAWKEKGDRRFVDIDDRAGLHTRKVAAKVVHLVFDYNTLWIQVDC
jgi:hypothetical protein